jgi:hypothetical protein
VPGWRQGCSGRAGADRMCVYWVGRRLGVGIRRRRRVYDHVIEGREAGKGYRFERTGDEESRPSRRLPPKRIRLGVIVLIHLKL